MKITRLPRDSGPAAWNALLDSPYPGGPLDTDITADWLVIGAGFAGLAAARRLAQLHPGDRITVLDAVGIGEGPVGRNSGFMIDLPHALNSENYSGQDETDASETWANRTAIEFALQAAQEYGMPGEAIARVGKINGAATDRGMAHNRAYAAHLAGLKEPHRQLDAAEMRDLTGSAYYKGGLFTPGTAMLQPALYAREVARGLTSNRVHVFQGTPVTGLTRTGGEWTARTPAGRVQAPKVILAVNGHAQSFGQFDGRLMHVMLYASMTCALTSDQIARLGGSAAWGITPADPMGTTVRRISGTGGDRIVIRNRCTWAPDLDADPAMLTRVARDHDAAFRARFPMLADVTMDYRWAGRLCLSLNDVPAFGEVEPGLFAACCQNGLGAAKGTFNGIAAADLASGLDTPVARYQVSKDAPKKLLPGLLMRLGAPARIRVKEWAAGREM